MHSGMPVVRVGRGNNEGFMPARDCLLGGHNLTFTKARLLLEHFPESRHRFPQKMRPTKEAGARFRFNLIETRSNGLPMKFGSLPPAVDPDRPIEAEMKSVRGLLHTSRSSDTFGSRRLDLSRMVDQWDSVLLHPCLTQRLTHLQSSCPTSLRSIDFLLPPVLFSIGASQ